MTGMAPPEGFAGTVAPLDAAELAAATAAAVAQVRLGLPEFTHAARNHSSVGNRYAAVPNDQWTAGFWPGQIWLSHEATGDPAFRAAGLVQVQSFLHRIEHRIETDHHDMGFLYSPSCVAAWKLTGNAEARRAALLAADQLAERFRPNGRFLQAWGRKDQPGEHRFIIDGLLNLPLLHWATAETGEGRYRAIAQAHARTALAHAIRPDASTWHTFYMHPETGAPSHGATKQGYRDDSAWARGQAWGICGMALVQRDDPDPAHLAAFERMLGFYLRHLPPDLVPYWDLTFTEGPEPRDTSAAAIVACGLLQMADLAGGERAARWRDLARRMVGSLFRDHAVRDPALSNGLLLHGTYSRKSPFNTCRGEGVDECLVWGDYFYLEALTRLRGGWTAYW